jgi:hypothetical protein
MSAIAYAAFELTVATLTVGAIAVSYCFLHSTRSVGKSHDGTTSV